MRRIDIFSKMFLNAGDPESAPDHPAELVAVPAAAGGSPFDLLVVDDDPRIGIFAAPIAAHLLTNCVNGVPGEDDQELLLKFARLIQDYPETQREIAKLTGNLNEAIAVINLALQKMSDVQ